jgi:hypothetical protein
VCFFKFIPPFRPVLHFPDYNSALFHPGPSTIIHIYFNKIKMTKFIVSPTNDRTHHIRVSRNEGVILRVNMHLQLPSNNCMIPEKISGTGHLIRNHH